MDKVSAESLLSVLWGMYLGVEFLDHVCGNSVSSLLRAAPHTLFTVAMYSLMIFPSKVSFVRPSLIPDPPHSLRNTQPIFL